ncbi:hypothetical protein RUM44_006131 [Polyplax serrata]|uniref:BRO1 domain-containing protein n=1 Tax=Polyplax serrata TaxID=468196 RepID=A0ABR1AZI0_POLSC
MAELLSVPLKKPTDVDLVQPLRNLVRGSFSSADHPEDCDNEIAEFNKMRNTAVWRVFEKYESSLEVVYSYYDQLVLLESKVPAHEVQIPFKWKDAFDKGSIFGTKIGLTICSLSYERVCVLYNIAALQSAVAASQLLDSDDALKLAAKLFQQAAGIFSHLKAAVVVAIHTEPTPDLNIDTLNALSALMLAQAQEIFVRKAILDQMKDAIIAKLCYQTEEMYAEVVNLFQKEILRNLWEKDWIPIVTGKQAAYHALAEYFQSLVCKSKKLIGEEIARLEHASELIKAAQSRSGKAQLFHDYSVKIEKNLAEAKKDNDFIYHERIPDVKSLPPIGKALLAKSLPVPEKFSNSNRDLFEKLCPLAVNQAVAAFDVRKSEVVNTEVNKLRDATNMLNSILASLNLPAAIENTSGNELPPSLLEKGDTVKQHGGLKSLQSTFTELPGLLQRNKEILDEACRLLDEEKESDDQLRSQFKEKWTRTTSDKLTEVFRSNASKYREIINNAMKADEVVAKKFESNRKGMELLSLPRDQMNNAVPSSSAAEQTIEQTEAVKQLRVLMEDVATIKAEREVIESELKSATIDMRPIFLRALADDGAISEATISNENLEKVYGTLQKQVQDSISRQEKLVLDTQKAHKQFAKETPKESAEREQTLKDMAVAYDAYIELENHLKEGSKFYNDLTQLLLAFQNKIKDFCLARKAEKEEHLKYLTQEASRFETTNPSPADGVKVPPPRPPPPTGTSSSTAYNTPYPTEYPAAMPVPYATGGAAPYPTYVPPPMPHGYSPYGTLPYPQQGNYQMPYQPPQGYPYPTQPGSSNPQNPPRQW